jgi:hypothetical protein
MKIIYIDAEFKCHTTNPDGAFREFEVPHFDEKCQAFIEGYRFLPAGESWTRSDGEVFQGEMIAPWKPYSELAAAQKQYEKDMLERADLEAAYNYLLTGGIA